MKKLPLITILSLAFLSTQGYPIECSTTVGGKADFRSLIIDSKVKRIADVTVESGFSGESNIHRLQVRVNDTFLGPVYHGFEAYISCNCNEPLVEGDSFIYFATSERPGHCMGTSNYQELKEGLKLWRDVRSNHDDA